MITDLRSNQSSLFSRFRQLLILVAIIALFTFTHQLALAVIDLIDLNAMKRAVVLTRDGELLFGAFAIAFAIKVPCSISQLAARRTSDADRGFGPSSRPQFAKIGTYGLCDLTRTFPAQPATLPAFITSRSRHFTCALVAMVQPT